MSESPAEDKGAVPALPDKPQQTSVEGLAQAAEIKAEAKAPAASQLPRTDKPALGDSTMTGTPLTVKQLVELLNPLSFLKWLKGSFADVF